MNFLLI